MSKEIIKSILNLAAVKPFINLQALNHSGNPTLAAIIEFVEFGHHEELLDAGPHPSGFNGWEVRYKFPNGYGASVIRYQSMKGLIESYGANDGLWQLAVLDKSGKLCYSTPITNDVLGWLTPEDVKNALNQIEALPPYQEEANSSSDEEDFFIQNSFFYCF